jgi:biopolymer transport protein ExbD
MRHRPRLAWSDAEVDLVPLIDCVFLLLLFFLLCGRMTLESRTEQITVPPARTARLVCNEEFHREIVNVRRLREGTEIRVGTHVFAGGDALVALRALLDRVWDGAEKDRGADGRERPRVVVELRADADTDYRAILDIERVLADAVDPATLMPRAAASRPFTTLDYTVRSATAN